MGGLKILGSSSPFLLAVVFFNSHSLNFQIKSFLLFFFLLFCDEDQCKSDKVFKCKKPTESRKKTNLTIPGSSVGF